MSWPLGQNRERWGIAGPSGIGGNSALERVSAAFTAELTAQLADARSTTTAKLDAPVNKLARLLNSASIKRVLLNRSLAVDFDAIIAGGEVLIVRGALGAMGSGNTAVLMQLLMGMLDAALARQQDLVPPADRRAVALKVDEAPLVINRGFAQTIALKRSAGLETVACWQSDAQWQEPELREQLDALFAHRVYFATASARDARAAAALTMAEFSDTVRPGIAHISALGSPGVRLHLPKHHAIVSLTTPAGRQQAFIARTLPMRTDPVRIALHADRQARRGGRYLEDLSQPHWERARRATVPASRPPGQPPPPGPAPREPPEPTEPARRTPPQQSSQPPGPTERAVRTAPEQGRQPSHPSQRPGPAPAGYAELVAIDRARSVRVARAPAVPVAHEPDALDLEILDLIARCGHVLSSEVHRHLGGPRAISTTQRRLKRLADAGLLSRLQLHGRDGAGAPMCCSPTDAGLDLLAAQGLRAREPAVAAGAVAAGTRKPVRPTADGLRRARRDLHVAGWALAFARLAGGEAVVRGASESALAPPERTVHDRRVPFAPADLRLPGGRVAHEFMSTGTAGARREAERFETVRPGATVSVEGIDILVELERRPAAAATGKLERYDHFLSGWCLHTRRYGTRARARPFVVLVCRDHAHARTLARAADLVLCASRAYAGERPEQWEYPGRERILFAAEVDIHRGAAAAFAVPPLPPALRAEPGGSPGGAQATARPARLPLPSRAGGRPASG